MPKKKPFIDKKSAVSFRLVHRSQRDPLIAADAEHVLAPIYSKPRSELKEEERKYGVDFDDDYNYLQHLRDANEVYSCEADPASAVLERFRVTKEGQCIDAGKDLPTVVPATADAVRDKISQLRIPSSVLATEDLELRTGLLNQAAPNFDPSELARLDPDVMAALDDDFDFADPDNALDDDFVRLANASPDTAEEAGPAHKAGEDEEDVDSEDMEASDADSDFDADKWAEEETRTRFTNYSVTSSVMRRSQGLQLLDQRFEKLYEQYDPEEIGDLEEAAVEGDGFKDGMAGHMDAASDRMLSMAAAYAEDKAAEKRLTEVALATQEEVIIEKARDAAAADSDEEAEAVVLEPSGSKRAWDCESICSTYSTLYNHPTLIAPPPSKRKKGPAKIFLNPKTGMPFVGQTSKRGKLAAALADLDRQTEESETVSVASRASTVRPKDETPEQRRLRKAAVKAERRERRVEKKANKMAFVEEKRRIVKSEINARNTVGMKL